MSLSTAVEKPGGGANVRSSKIVYSIQQLLEIGEGLGYRSARMDTNWRRNKQKKQSDFDRSRRGRSPYLYPEKQKLGQSNAFRSSSSGKGGSVINGQSLPPSSPTDDLWDMPKEEGVDSMGGGLFSLASSTLEYECELYREKYSIVSPPSPSSIPLCHPDSPSIQSDALQSIPPPSTSSQYTIATVAEHRLPIPTSKNGDDGQVSFSEDSNNYINELFASSWISTTTRVPDSMAEPCRASRLSQLSQRSDLSNFMSLSSDGIVDSEEFCRAMLSSTRPSHVTTASISEGGIQKAESLQLKHSPMYGSTNFLMPPPPGLTTSNHLSSTPNCTNMEEFRGLALERAMTHHVVNSEGGVRDEEALQHQNGSCSMSGDNAAVPQSPPLPPGLIVPKQQKTNKEMDLSTTILNGDIYPAQTTISRRIPKVAVLQSPIHQQVRNSFEEISLSSESCISTTKNVISEKLQQPSSTTPLQSLSSTSSTPRQQHHQLQESSSKVVDIVKILGLEPPPVFKASTKESDAPMLETELTTQRDRGSQKFVFHTHYNIPQLKTRRSSALKSFPGDQYLERIKAQKSSGEPKPIQVQSINNISSVPHQLLKKMLGDRSSDKQGDTTVSGKV